MSTPIVIAILMNTVIAHTVVKNRCLDQHEYSLMKNCYDWKQEKRIYKGVGIFENFFPFLVTLTILWELSSFHVQFSAWWLSIETYCSTEVSLLFIFDK